MTKSGTIAHPGTKTRKFVSTSARVGTLRVAERAPTAQGEAKACDVESDAKSLATTSTWYPWRASSNALVKPTTSKAEPAGQSFDVRSQERAKG